MVSQSANGLGNPHQPYKGAPALHVSADARLRGLIPTFSVLLSELFSKFQYLYHTPSRGPISLFYFMIEAIKDMRTPSSAAPLGNLPDDGGFDVLRQPA